MADLASISARIPFPFRWETRAGDHGTLIVILSSEIGGVTIDLEGRFFQLGFETHPPRPYDMAAKYKGRGWQERLIDDAVSALRQTRRTRRG